MYKAEILGKIPDIMHFLLVVFIPKQAGGVRPIGLFTASLRLWGRIRRVVAAQWEREHCRTYFWGGQGKSAEQCVWDQSLLNEYAEASGRAAGSVLLDLVKAYELVRHRLCARKCRDMGIPLHYARWCLLTYAGPRVLKLEGVCSPVYRVSTSIVAGCAGATTLLRAILLRSCDAVVSLCPEVRLKVVVDDISLQAIGSASDVSINLSRATDIIAEKLETDVQATLSRSKSIVIASSAALERSIWNALTHKLLVSKAVKKFGVDVCCRGRTTATQRLRIVTVAKRRGKYQFLRRNGGNMAKVAKTGALPSMTYGASVNNVGDVALANV